VTEERPIKARKGRKREEEYATHLPELAPSPLLGGENLALPPRSSMKEVGGCLSQARAMAQAHAPKEPKRSKAAE
jgi:hypothetical protein